MKTISFPRYFPLKTLPFLFMVAFFMIPTPSHASEKLHLFAGAGVSGQNLNFKIQTFQDLSDTNPSLDLVGLFEVSVLNFLADARVGAQLELLNGTNDLLETTHQHTIGIYGKVQFSFLYGALGYKRVAITPDISQVPISDVELSEWLFFQTLGLEMKVSKISLNFEYQHTSGDIEDDRLPQGVYHYRRHAGRVLVGLHF